MNEALAGFADPSIILIAALFVIGEGLVMTGVARRLARREGRRERSARRPGLLRGLPVQPQGGDERRPMA
jgi:hypothetical protein